MAVANAIGSNVFDILLCLGLPWLLSSTIVNPGEFVTVASRGVFYSTISLFATVLLFIILLHISYWRLTKKVGWILIVWYFLFTIFASLYELNIFGLVNPRTCELDW